MTVTAEANAPKPYPPHFIHAFYDWLDRLPLPDWLSLVLLLVAVGIAQHLVAWSRGLLPNGQFSYDLGTAGMYLASLFVGIYVLKGAPSALDEFRPLLTVTDEEYARLRYQFVTIPSGLGTVFFLLGVASGVVSGLSDMAVAPAVDYAFPQMRLGIWMIGGGVFLLFAYQVARQLRQIGAFYAMPEVISVFSPRPLYGFSRYTATLGILAFLTFAVSIFDPTAYASFSTPALVVYFAAVVSPILLVFYLPLAGVHRRLVAEKDRLLHEVGLRIEEMLVRINLAAFEEQDYKDVGSMRTVLSALREEKQTIVELSTWPWRPGTFTRLLSALLLPAVLVVIRELVSMLVAP